MTLLGTRTASALLLAGILCAASPAFADHDDHHGHGHGHWEHHHEHHGDWDHRHAYYYGGGYTHHYYYEPDYYAAPRVYVPAPPPPSFGLNLVFPIR